MIPEGVAPEPFAVPAAALLICGLYLIYEKTIARGKTMLILTRRPGETIVIETPSGEKVDVTVLQNNGPQVRLGVTAPKATTIDRQEIYQRKKAEASYG